MEFLSLLVSLILTALVYGIAPIIFYYTRKKPLRKRTLKAFHIIYTSVVALFFAFESSFAGLGVKFTPAILWGLLFYHINKVKLSDKGLLICEENDDNVTNSPPKSDKPEILTPSKSCELIQPTESPIQPTSIAPTTRKPRISSIAPIIILSALLLTSVLGNVLQAIYAQSLNETINSVSTERDNLSREINSLETDINSLKSVRTNLKSEIESLEDKLDNHMQYFENTYFSIGYIVEGSSYYHCYDCPVYTAADTYWAHNIEYCEYLGYSACPLCRAG